MSIFLPSLDKERPSSIPHLDFRGESQRPARTDLPTCDGDGFIFYKRDFTSRELQIIHPLLASAEFKALAPESVFFRAAWLIERTGGTSPDVANALLFATWSAKNSADYARYATALLAKLPAAAATEADFRRKLQYRLLRGEILRRLGHFEQAEQYFQDFLAEFGEGDTASTLAHLELERIATHDDGDYLPQFDEIWGESGSKSWRAARVPLLSTSSHFSRVAAWKPAAGVFLFDRRSHALVGGNPLELVPITGSPTQAIETVPDAPLPIATLPNNRLLQFIQNPEHFSDVTLDAPPAYKVPDTPQQNSVRTMTYPDLPQLISYDQKLVAVGWGARGITAYDTTERKFVSLSGPDNLDRFLSFDPSGPRFIADGGHGSPLTLWNYDQGMADLVISDPCKFADGSGLCAVVAAIVDDRHKMLHVLLRSDTVLRNLSLLSYSLEGGKLLHLSSMIAEHPGYFVTPPFRWPLPTPGQPILTSNGRHLLVKFDGLIDVFDAADPEKMVEGITAPRDYTFDRIEFSPDGNYLGVEIEGVTSLLAVTRTSSP